MADKKAPYKVGEFIVFKSQNSAGTMIFKHRRILIHLLEIPVSSLKSLDVIFTKIL